MYGSLMSKTFADLIGTWPRDPQEDRTSIGSFAADIGVPYQHAATMKQRNSIAVEFWPAVIRAAGRRGIEITNDSLLKMRQTRRKKTRIGRKKKAEERVAA